MPLSQIIALLRQTVGLDVSSVGVNLVERAVKRRIHANDLGDLSQYIELIQRSEPELQSLLEAVVVSETFFFRYPESFAALRQIVEEQFLTKTEKMRVLSVPCSTGEEPYSIAMTLLEAGMPLERFHIDAVDINGHSLDLAVGGVFGSNSFRGDELQFRNRYFQKTAAGLRICDRVRQSVKFEQGNVLEPSFRFGGPPYDFIFCRNLLIYFSTEAQDQALKGLKQLLTGDGLLFVGSAETALLSQRGLSSVKFPMAFVFGKRESVSSPAQPKRKPSKSWPPAKAHRRETYVKPDLATIKKSRPVVANKEHSLGPDLALAERLADQGQLGEAEKICEICLRQQGPSARAFHLLGVIRDCSGDQYQASEFYRKALYLEPDHYEVLIHFALLKDKSGDSAAARTLKSRARRVLEQTK
jgi:chemotaxis protein methyltransferase WspC